VGKNKYHLENTEALLEASDKAGLKANAEKTKHMFMSHNQNAGQNHNLVKANEALKMRQS